MSTKSNFALIAAIEAVEHLASQNPSKPEHDEALFILRQLHQMNREALERADYLVAQAQETRRVVDKAFRETKIRIAIREQELGLDQPEEDEEHA